MEPVSLVMGSVLAAFALAVAGGVLSATLGVSHRRLCALISLGAGALLGTTLFGILPESWHQMKGWELFLALASGYGLFFLLSRYVHHVCPACAASHFDEEATHRFSEFAVALIVALTIHSTLDGFGLAAGHECEAHGHTGQGRLGWGLLVAICVHKVPEGLALGALLLGAGVGRLGAVAWVAVVEATTVMGGVLGLFFLREASPFWMSAVLAHVGGGFVYLAAHAILGEMTKHGKSLVVVNFMAGLAGVGLLTLLVRFA